MKLVRTIPMPPYLYQEPEWLKPRRTRTVYSVGEALLAKLEKPESQP